VALQHERRRLHDAGREEEWTLSVTHTDEAVDRYVAVFAEMARDVTA
jgi:glutamate-1-semialdehyde 2,1-aminomutase